MFAKRTFGSLSFIVDLLFNHIIGLGTLYVRQIDSLSMLYVCSPKIYNVDSKFMFSPCSVFLQSSLEFSSRVQVFQFSYYFEYSKNPILQVRNSLQVSLTMDRQSAEPGERVKLKVKADPNSYVGLLAVDQSVLLLKSGNDITKEMVRCFLL